MRSRISNLALEADGVDSEALVDRSETARKQYSRGRSRRTPKRRSSRAAGANIPVGIAGRRKRRWSW
jgi:hypothetical protein